ncbi:hypothetical protein ACLQ3C_18960 [Gordonia sp. DT30]|uniref:hypothetical protein n=1 Tax=Gordonia sp. DT30 TaxID=3416546 RepID=UPI003CF4B66E
MRGGEVHPAPVAMASFAGPTGGGYHDTAAHSTISTDAGVVVADAGPGPGSVAVFDLDRDARRRRR